MAGERKVAFTEDAARRVAAATLAYERGNRDMPPVRFRTASGDDGGEVRLCKTSSAWEVNTVATLNVYEDGTPPDETQTADLTVEAVNHSYKVAANVWVVVAKAANGTWYLVEAGDAEPDDGCNPPSIGGRDLTDLPSYDEDQNQSLGHREGCLEWMHEPRLGTASAPWDKGTTATVTQIKPDGGELSPEVTFSATNYFADVQGTGQKKVLCVFVGDRWILAAAEC